MKKKLGYILILFSPLVSLAQSSDLNGVADGVNKVLYYIVPVIIGLSLLSFLWGILNYILHGSEEGQREESKQFMIWGVVGMFVMVSVWGIVFMFAHTLGVNVYSLTPQLPALGK